MIQNPHRVSFFCRYSNSSIFLSHPYAFLRTFFLSRHPPSSWRWRTGFPVGRATDASSSFHPSWFLGCTWTIQQFPFYWGFIRSPFQTLIKPLRHRIVWKQQLFTNGSKRLECPSDLGESFRYNQNIQSTEEKLKRKSLTSQFYTCSKPAGAKDVIFSYNIGFIWW